MDLGSTVARRILVLFGLALLLVPAPVSAGVARERWGFYVAYDPESRRSLTDHRSQLDVVVPDYFGMQADGSIVGADDPAIDALVRGAGGRLLPLLQNRVRYGELSTLLNDPGRRRRAVGEVVQRVTRYGYDGVTLDFEAVSPADRDGLTAFVRELAGALHAQGKSLAVAVPARSGEMSTGWAGAFDYAAIGSTVDRVIVMAYAFRTAAATQPGPISPLPWVREVVSYAEAVVPRDHLVLGVGLWGYDWNVSQPKRAQTLAFRQIHDLLARGSGSLAFDVESGEPVYRYQNGADAHEVWFENATSVQAKLDLADQQQLAGVAFWRLGQEDPAIWSEPADPPIPDFAVPDGWFYTQTGGGGGRGYRVVDDAQARFWSEFRQLGGVTTLGYPSSRRFVGADGFVYQVFQRGILQWRPESQTAVLANTFEQLTAAGQDERLESLGIPRPILDDGSQGDWNRARQIRLGWLTNPAIARAFTSPPGPNPGPWSLDRSIQLYGLPSSAPARSGPFVVQRFQRISLQLWVEDVPGMPRRGSVVGILGGDLFKQAGLIPAAAAVPELP